MQLNYTFDTHKTCKVALSLFLLQLQKGSCKDFAIYTLKKEFAFMDDTALQLGIFDQRCFYNAFAEFDQQSIEMSLKSENLIVRIFAVLDRRVGKRRLALMKETIAEEPDTFREFYAIRMKAEGLI